MARHYGLPQPVRREPVETDYLRLALAIVAAFVIALAIIALGALFMTGAGA